MPHPDAPGLLALYRRIENGPDGERSGATHCSLLQVFSALVQYRNGVQGHGGPRFDSFYETEMGPLLFPAANDLLADGTFALVGPRGTRLLYLTELRLIDDNKAELGLRELIGLQGERSAACAARARGGRRTRREPRGHTVARPIGPLDS